jgi:hypothetical protein
MSSPHTQDLADIRHLQRQAASLLLYQSVLQDVVGKAFLTLLPALHHSDGSEAAILLGLQAYGDWFKALATANLSWQDYLIIQILQDDNPFTQQAQQTAWESLPPVLVAAAQHDLQALQSLYQCSHQSLSHWVQQLKLGTKAPIAKSHLPAIPLTWDNSASALDVRELAIANRLAKIDNWADALPDLVVHYQQHGTGLFARYRAFRWQCGQLIGIADPDPVQLTDLCGYESPKEALLKNTEFLLSGYPALNVLLYGSRGSGKSSLVKALLNKYTNSQLRLIEVAKSDLQDLPVIVEQLRSVPQKFIIFVDDLSFEEDDDAFKALKVVLEGSLTARPKNVVVYATSNRRHLIREFFADRPRPSDNEEIHAWDTLQEKLSFSDRFGLTLTFEPADQNTYLNIVRQLAVQAEIELSPADLEFRALQWATRHNGRSGRTARQFVDFLQCEIKTTDKHRCN